MNWFAWIVGALLVTITLVGASAVGNEKYVQLVSHTTQCNTNCKTIYNITAVDYPITLDWSNAWVSFKERKTDLVLKDSEDVPTLKEWDLRRHVITEKVVPCSGVKNESKDCTQKVESWEIANWSQVLMPGESYLIEVVGSIEEGKSADNVLVLTINGERHEYTQWAQWDYATDATGGTFGSGVGQGEANCPGQLIKFINQTVLYNLTNATRAAGSDANLFRIYSCNTSQISNYTVTGATSYPGVILNGSHLYYVCFTKAAAWTSVYNAQVYPIVGTNIAYRKQVSADADCVDTAANSDLHNTVSISTAKWTNETIPPPAPSPFTVLSAQGNLTVREVSVQSWNLTTLWNTTAISSINATFNYGTRTNSTRQITTVFNATHNQTIFVAEFRTNITSAANNTATAWNFTYTVNYANGTIYNNVTANNASNTTYSYFWNGLTTQNPIWEGNSTTIQFNLTKLEGNVAGVNIHVDITGNANTVPFLRWKGAPTASISGNSGLDSNTSTNSLYSIAVVPTFIVTNATNATANVQGSGVFQDSTSSRSITGITTADNVQVWSYFITQIQVSSNSILANTTTYFNTTVFTQNKNYQTLTVNFSVNGTNVPGTLLTNSSSYEIWGANYNFPNVTTGQTNYTYLINATLNVYNSSGSLYSRPADTSLLQNITAYIFVLTSCDTSLTNRRILNFTILDVLNTTRLVTTNVQENHNVNIGLVNLSFPFTRVSVNNWSICAFPNITFSLLDTSIVQVGDGVIYAYSSYTFGDTITPTNTILHNLYATNLSTPNLGLITITVQDSTTIPIPYAAVDTYKYYPATNTYVLVGQDVLSSQGEMVAYLELYSVFYKFIVYTDATRTTILTTDIRKIFSLTETIILGASSTPVWNIYNSLLQGYGNVIANNATQSFILNFNFPSNTISGFTLEKTCLLVSYVPNNSNTNWTQYSSSCLNATSGQITIPINPALGDVWIGIGYANTSQSPSEMNPIGSAVMDLRKALGSLGIFLTYLLVVAGASATFWNPAAAVLMTGGIVAIFATMGIITGLHSGIAITIIVLSAVVSWIIKS